MKSSKAYATVFFLKEYCQEHQTDEPWLIIGFIVNTANGTKRTEKEFFDYLWDKGFNENLCLRT